MLMMGELGKRPTEKDLFIVDEIYHCVFRAGQVTRGFAVIPAKSMI